jgi:hypothetical protein
VNAHVTSCLLCRIKRQRLTGVAPIDLTDIRDLKVPEFGVIEIVDAAGTEARRGELWLTASDDATMVLVRTIRDDDYGVVVVPVTLDVEVADNGALILDTSASPLVVPIAIYDRLPISLPSSALAGRVVPLRSGLDLLSLATGDPGVSRGSPLEGSADPRLEVRQYLSDRLVALDSYEAADDGDDPLPIEADSRMSTLRHEITLRRGASCEVEVLESLPFLAEFPHEWSGFALIKEFMLRIIVIDTPVGLIDDRDYVCAQALLTRLDGSALVVCSRRKDIVDFYDAPSLFRAFELPDGGRASGPSISGLSLADAIAKFLDQQRIVISDFGSLGRHVGRVNVQEILVDQVDGTVNDYLGRASRYGREKRDGFVALAGLKDALTELLKTALEADFDPQAIVALVDREDR